MLMPTKQFKQERYQGCIVGIIEVEFGEGA